MEILKDLVAKLQLLCSLETAIIQELEDMRKELEAVKADNKRIVAENRTLKTQFAELMMAFGAWKQDQHDAYMKQLQEAQKASGGAQNG